MRRRDGQEPFETGEGVEIWSRIPFVVVRERMERLGQDPALKAGDAALLCAWVWSLGGRQSFQSSDAQKLFGPEGRKLNANHFNRLAKRGAHGKHAGEAMLRWDRKGCFKLTPEGQREGERLAQRYLLGKTQAEPGNQEMA